MDNSEINKFIVLEIKSYTFTEDIEQIYNCFLSSSILGKIETKGYPYSLTELKDKEENAKTCYSLEWNQPRHFQIVVQYTHQTKGRYHKTLTKKVMMINHKKLNCTFQIKLSYVNTCNHSTFLTIEEEAEIKDELYDVYNNSVAFQSLKVVFQSVQKFLTFWNHSILQMDSIVINRPMFQIWRFISNSSNDSQGILLVKLSPVTTYVCLENEIPLLSTDSQRKSISEMQQYLLKEFRDKLEKNNLPL